MGTIPPLMNPLVRRIALRADEGEDSGGSGWDGYVDDAGVAGDGDTGEEVFDNSSIHKATFPAGNGLGDGVVGRVDKYDDGVEGAIGFAGKAEEAVGV